jgi:hypothetical protein
LEQTEVLKLWVVQAEMVVEAVVVLVQAEQHIMAVQGVAEQAVWAEQLCLFMIHFQMTAVLVWQAEQAVQVELVVTVLEVMEPLAEMETLLLRLKLIK